MSNPRIPWPVRVWRSFLAGHKKRRAFLINLLHQGVTAEKIALSVAVGTIAGVFPIIGMTTILAFLAAVWLRLNLVVVQIFNGVTYPLQILCILPLIKLGQSVFGEESVHLAPEAVMTLLQEDRTVAMSQLWSFTWKAMAAWGLLAPLLTATLYYSLLPFIRKLRTVEAKPQPTIDSATPTIDPSL